MMYKILEERLRRYSTGLVAEYSQKTFQRQGELMTWNRNNAARIWLMLVGVLCCGSVMPLVAQFTATERLLEEATEISQKFKIGSDEADAFKEKMEDLASPEELASMTAAQEASYRSLLEWGLYSGIIKDSYNATPEAWIANEAVTLFTSGIASLGVEATVPETYEDWIEYLNDNFRVYCDSGPEKVDRLITENRLMDKTKFITKLEELVMERLDTLSVGEFEENTIKLLPFGGILGGATSMEIVEDSWIDLLSLIDSMFYVDVFKPIQQKIMQLRERLKAPISFEERIESLKRFNINCKLDDDPIVITNIAGFAFRVKRLINVLAPSVSTEKRQAARDQVRSYILRNRENLDPETERPQFQKYVEMLEREVVSTEIFRDGELIALRYREDPSVEPVYCQIVQVKDGDGSVVEGQYTLAALGESLADPTCHFVVNVTSAEKAITFSTFLINGLPQFVFETDSEGQAFVSGAEGAERYSLASGISMGFSPNPVADTVDAMYLFQPEVFNKQLAFKSIYVGEPSDSEHGYLTLDSQKHCVTFNELTGPTGIRSADGKLQPTKWGKFEVVRIASFYSDLAKVRVIPEVNGMPDIAGRLKDYENIVQSIAAVTGSVGPEARVTFIKELEHFLEEQKTGEAVWDTFIGSFGDRVVQLWEMTRDYFDDFFGSEPQVRDALAELASFMEAPPTVSEPHEDAPPDGTMVTIKSELNGKYLQVVEVLESGVPTYYLSATADDPIDASTHLKVVAYKGLLGFVSAMAQGMRLQVTEISPEETKWMTPEVKARKTRVSFAPAIISESGTPASFKSHENKREQFVMADSDGVYKLENLALENGFLTVDTGGFLRVYNADASGAADLSAGPNAQAIDIIPLMPLHTELGKVREEAGTLERLKRYVSLVSYIESESDISFLLYEVEKFVIEKKQSLTSWQDFTENESFAEQKEKLLTALAGVIPGVPAGADANVAARITKLQEDFARLRGIWESPFVSELEDGSTVVVKWRNTAGEERLLRIEQDNETGNYYLRAIGGDRLDSATHLRVRVTSDSKIIFSAPSILEERLKMQQSGDLFDVSETEAWILQIKDIIGVDDEKGQPFPSQFVLDPADDNAIRFAMIGPETGAGFKNVETGGFITVSTIDQRIGTLESLIGKRAGIVRKETKADGTVVEKLEPSSRETFQIVVLSEFDLLLTQLRAEAPDIPGAQSVMQSFLAASEAVAKTEDRENIVREVERWVRFAQTKPDFWDDIHNPINGISTTFEALIANLKSIAPSARAKDRVQSIAEMWSGITGERIPTDGQTVGIRVNVAREPDGTTVDYQNPDYRYLHAVQEDEMGRPVYYLGATAESPIGADAQFNIVWQENKLGLVSKFAEGRRLRVPVLAQDVSDWADVARARGSRLIFEKLLKTSRGREVHFTDDQNLADQIIIIEEVEDEDILNTFKLRSRLHDIDQTGYLRVDVSDGFIRAVDIGNPYLPALQIANGAVFEFIRIEPFHTALTELRSETNDLKRVQQYGALTVQVRGDDDILWLMDEVNNFISGKKETEQSWNVFVQNTALTRTLEELFDRLDEAFGISNLVPTTHPLQVALRNLKTNFSTPFGEVLTDGARVVLKWKDARGELFYLRAVKEVFNDIILYRLKADGTDLLEAAASLDIKVSEDGLTEFVSAWVQGDPDTNDVEHKLMIQDATGERNPAQFMQYVSGVKFEFITEGSRVKVAFKSRETGGYLSVGKVDRLISTLDAATNRPAGMMRGDRLVNSSWETFEVIELSDFAKNLADLRKVEDLQVRLSGYISAIEAVETEEDRSFLIGEIQHWVTTTTSNWELWSAIQGDEDLKAFADELVVGVSVVATTPELRGLTSVIDSEWQAGFMGEPHEEAPPVGATVALMVETEEKMYIDTAGRLVSDPNDAWTESLENVQNDYSRADGIQSVYSPVTQSAKSNYGYNDGKIECIWEYPPDDTMPSTAYGKHYKMVSVKLFLKAEGNRGLGGIKCLRAPWNVAENIGREDDPFDSSARFKVLIKGNRIGLQSEFAEGKNLGVFPVDAETASRWDLTTKYNETCAQFKTVDFETMGNNSEHFIMEGSRNAALLKSVSVGGYLSIEGSDRYVRVLNPEGGMMPYLQDVNAANSKWSKFHIVEFSAFHQTMSAARVERVSRMKLRRYEDAMYQIATSLDLQLMVGELERFYDIQAKTEISWNMFKGDKAAVKQFMDLTAHERFKAADIPKEILDRLDNLVVGRLTDDPNLKDPVELEKIGVEEEVLTFE
ncbi:hypothetical protein KAT92_02160, partial [Candidatus Babeliales bacterium]|nr:hypothetical protein [Candidatus Babeliales bacterium]